MLQHADSHSDDLSGDTISCDDDPNIVRTRPKPEITCLESPEDASNGIRKNGEILVQRPANKEYRTTTVISVVTQTYTAPASPASTL